MPFSVFKSSFNFIVNIVAMKTCHKSFIRRTTMQKESVEYQTFSFTQIYLYTVLDVVMTAMLDSSMSSVIFVHSFVGIWMNQQ